MGDKDLLTCSFRQFSKKDCQLSSRYRSIKSILSLKKCSNSTKEHLNGCFKTSYEGVEDEGKLCLARVGLFDESGEDYTICPEHRAEFGIGWRPSKVCKYPEHDCKQKPFRGISKSMSKIIYLHFGMLCVTGQGKHKLYVVVAVVFRHIQAPGMVEYFHYQLSVHDFKV